MCFSEISGGIFKQLARKHFLQELSWDGEKLTCTYVYTYNYYAHNLYSKYIHVIMMFLTDINILFVFLSTYTVYQWLSMIIKICFIY